MEKLYKNKEWLQEQYCKNDLTLEEMGNIAGCSFCTIRDWMDKYNIKRRKWNDFTDRAMKKRSKSLSGKNNPMYGKHISKETKQKISEVTSGENHWKWNGGKRRNRCGYIEIYVKDHPFKTARNIVMEHKLVMENWLRENDPQNIALTNINGKLYLKPEYVVDHKNRIKDDNRIENLRVMKKRDHDSIHSKGENNPMYRKHHSEKTIQKLSEMAKKRWKEDDIYDRNQPRDQLGHFISKSDFNHPIISTWGF